MKKRFFALCTAVWLSVVCSFSVAAFDSVGYCITCDKNCEYVIGCEYMNEENHAVRHWCTECGYDQLAGCNIQKHDRTGECCVRMYPPENIEVFDFRDGMLICFEPSEDTDGYTVAVYGENIYEDCHFIETDNAFLRISADEYEWFEPLREYTVRVQALSGYYESLFSYEVMGLLRICEDSNIKGLFRKKYFSEL